MDDVTLLNLKHHWYRHICHVNIVSESWDSRFRLQHLNVEIHLKLEGPYSKKINTKFSGNM